MQSQAPRLTVLTTTRSVSGSAWQALASKLPLTSRLQDRLDGLPQESADAPEAQGHPGHTAHG